MLRTHGRPLDYRLPVTILAGLSIAVFFWLSSRYPALNDKALMGGDASIAGLAFDTIARVYPDSALWWELLANMLNWLYTNWRGMVFGIIFGSVFLTALSLVRRRFFQNGFANAALGGAIGAPLGVCANCAAPIAYGLIRGGLRPETALAALIASPTLNVIVVTMSFAVLPAYMAVLKLVAMIILIFLIVPALVALMDPPREPVDETAIGLAPQSDTSPGPASSRFLETSAPADRDQEPHSLARSLVWFVVQFLRNLYVVVIATVPLMLAAAVFASIAVTLIPVDVALEELPFSDEFGAMLIAILIVAVVGTLLPVPIAFDVILVAILLQAGIQAQYAAALLVTLGAYSIYSYVIVGRALSPALSGAVLAAVIAIGATAGLVTPYIEHWVAKSVRQANVEILASAAPLQLKAFAKPAPNSETTGAPALGSKLPPQSIINVEIDHSGKGRISLSGRTLNPRSKPAGAAHDRQFARIPGQQLGLRTWHNITLLHGLSPLTKYHAIAAGDIDGDDWGDIVLARDALEGGVEHYRNLGGTFSKQRIELGLEAGTFVNAVALFDFDNDHDLDLYIATFDKGIFVYENRAGSFRADRRLRIPNGQAVLAGATGFADLDGDGSLDIVHGNWFGGLVVAPYRGVHEAQRNRIVWNDTQTDFMHKKVQLADLSGLPGETLAILVTDVNNDGLPDIMTGDDFAATDKIYINERDRHFRVAQRADKTVPWLAMSTMSFDVGDVDNDLRPDLYIGQIALPSRIIDFPDRQRPWQRICQSLESDGSIATGHLPTCFRRIRGMSQVRRFGRLGACHRLVEPDARSLCAAMAHFWNNGIENRPEECGMINRSWPYVHDICLRAAAPRHRLSRAERRMGEAFDVVRNANVLLRGQPLGGFKDIADTAHVDKPGWTWNAKFADLDHDGWQDLLVLTDLFTSSKFYRNLEGKGFSNETEKTGLTDPQPAYSSVFLDIDKDGDLDIVRSPSYGYPVVFRNNTQAGRSLQISLRDEIANSFGIGARIELHFDEPGKAMMRILKASGGFNSFDPPSVHFGYPRGRKLKTLRVIWPDREISTISYPVNLQRDMEIVIRRTRAGTPHETR